MADLPKIIESDRVVVVEGQDEENFFNALFAHLHITGIQLAQVGGVKKFLSKMPSLRKTPGFDGTVKKFAIVRDRNGDNAFESIVNIVKKIDLVPPSQEGSFSSGNPSVGVFIMPGQNVEGTMLEDLCLKTVENHPAMKCVDEFQYCVSRLTPPPKNISKCKAQAYLAAQEEIANTVGLGAQKKYWDFDASCLEELKNFLENLR